MPWFRLEDSFHSHPKVLVAGNEAIGLYVRCGTYAAQHLTDGFIPAHIALLYGDETLVDTLVKAGLWRRARGGWRMPDYLDYNPSKEAVEKDRKGKAERQKRWREAKRRRVTNASSNAPGDAAPPRPAPKEGGGGDAPVAPGTAGRRGASGRANPSGSPVRAVPEWCGKCDNPNTRYVEDDEGRAKRCPTCHPRREEAS